jgi:hypothetical protein
MKKAYVIVRLLQLLSYIHINKSKDLLYAQQAVMVQLACTTVCMTEMFRGRAYVQSHATCVISSFISGQYAD